MKWLFNMFKTQPPAAPAVPMLQDTPPSTRDRARAAIHVARFERALAQCAKGEARRAELAAWLEYWQAVARLPQKPE
ncbi:MAG: hypothetical protein DCC73_11445 [Proteobacteria bacterium]|jgi:hypothetical protein|nr:MAG: hypothetical protein DCC73_11445 [Pseudomonadota bacterium]